MGTETHTLNDEGFRTTMEAIARLFDGEGGSTFWAEVAREVASVSSTDREKAANRFLCLIPGMGNMGDWVFHIDHSPARTIESSYEKFDPLKTPLDISQIHQITLLSEKNSEFMKLMSDAATWSKLHTSLDSNYAADLVSRFP